VMPGRWCRRKAASLTRAATRPAARLPPPSSRPTSWAATSRGAPRAGKPRAARHRTSRRLRRPPEKPRSRGQLTGPRRVTFTKKIRQSEANSALRDNSNRNKNQKTTATKTSTLSPLMLIFTRIFFIPWKIKSPPKPAPANQQLPLAPCLLHCFPCLSVRYIYVTTTVPYHRCLYLHNMYGIKKTNHYTPHNHKLKLKKKN